MCRLFASQDPATYAPETRAIRLHGHVTSVRLEAAFWDTLGEIAAHQGITVNRFIALLHDEVSMREGRVGNLASLLRVSCLHWLRHQDLHEAQRHEGERQGARRVAGCADPETVAHENLLDVA